MIFLSGQIIYICIINNPILYIILWKHLFTMYQWIYLQTLSYIQLDPTHSWCSICQLLRIYIYIYNILFYLFCLFPKMTLCYVLPVGGSHFFISTNVHNFSPEFVNFITLNGLCQKFAFVSLVETCLNLKNIFSVWSVLKQIWCSNFWFSCWKLYFRCSPKSLRSYCLASWCST